jgi:hypothetical protein
LAPAPHLLDELPAAREDAKQLANATTIKDAAHKFGESALISPAQSPDEFMALVVQKSLQTGTVQPGLYVPAPAPAGQRLRIG